MGLASHDDSELDRGVMIESSFGDFCGQVEESGVFDDGHKLGEVLA